MGKFKVKLFQIFTICCFIFLIIASLRIWSFAQSRYKAEMAVRLSPFSKTSAVKGAENKNQSKKILLLGDSRIKEWSEYESLGKVCWNAGVGGETTDQILLRSTKIVNDIKPDVVIIQAGFNDLKAVNLFNNKKEIIENCIENLLSIKSECELSGAKVYLTTIMPAHDLNWKRLLLWRGHPNQAIFEANEILLLKCKDSKILNLNQVFKDSLLDVFYKEDGVHLTKKCYQELNKLILNELASEPPLFLLE